jgi:MFS family permease
MFWVVVAFIVIFMGLHGATLVPGVWTYIPEIATKQEIRWSRVTGWFASGTSVALFIYIGQTFGYAAIFFTFGAFTMICFVFNVSYMVTIKPKLKDVVNMELRKINLNSTDTDDDRYDVEKH